MLSYGGRGNAKSVPGLQPPQTANKALRCLAIRIIAHLCILRIFSMMGKRRPHVMKWLGCLPIATPSDNTYELRLTVHLECMLASASGLRG